MILNNGQKFQLWGNRTEQHMCQMKALLPFTTAWMELESTMLSEISKVVKDKYHTISPVSGT